MNAKSLTGKCIFATIIYFSTLISLHAQRQFQDGFVITTNKDTLVGQVSNIHKHTHDYIDFRYPNGTDTIFTPNHISAYEIGNQRYIVVPLPHPTRNDTAFLFAHVLVDGYASLYKTRIKIDPLSAAMDAFLCKKYNEKEYYPAGHMDHLAIFFKDYPVLNNELVNHCHLYSNNLETKMQLFNHYNAWKRYQLDSLSKNSNSTASHKVEKVALEVFMKDGTNLIPESKFQLDKITGKLSAMPNLRMTIEFLNSGANPALEKQAMKAILLHLNEYDARIEEQTISLPENLSIKPSQKNGQIIFYYFK